MRVLQGIPLFGLLTLFAVTAMPDASPNLVQLDDGDFGEIGSEPVAAEEEGVLRHGLSELQQDARVEDGTIRRNRLGESDSGVDLVNGLFVPNSLGASASAAKKHTKVKVSPVKKGASTEDKAKEARAMVSQVKKDIDAAFNEYTAAQAAKGTLDKAASKQAAEKVKQAVKKDSRTVAPSPPRKRKGFEIDNNKPWVVRLVNPDGTAKLAPNVPDDSEDTTETIINAMHNLKSSTVEAIRNKTRARFKESKGLNPEWLNEKDKFEFINSKLTQNITQERLDIKLHSAEIKHKARKEREQEERAKAQKKNINKIKDKQKKKESQVKSKEKGVKIRTDAQPVVARDKTNLVISNVPPAPANLSKGAPAGVPKYATFHNSAQDAAVQLTIDALTNCPDFNDWVKEKPQSDVDTAARLRKEAFIEMNTQRVATATALSEISILTSAIVEKTQALAAISGDSATAQRQGYLKFEEKAHSSIVKWKNDLEVLANDAVKCTSPNCKDDTWKIWNKFERLLLLSKDAQDLFSEWANSMQLTGNKGHMAFKSAVEHRLWGQLYEMKDDLFRRLPSLAAETDKEKAIVSLYQDRVKEEMRAKQSVIVLSRFPIPDVVWLPVNVNGTEVQQSIHTREWANCRCPLTSRDGKLVCKYCDRELFRESPVYSKYGMKSIEERFENKQLLWGSSPRKNPITCDLDNAASESERKCSYICKWNSVYGANWYGEAKLKRCTKLHPKPGTERDRCVDSFIQIPLKAGKNKGANVAMCEAQMSLQKLYEMKWNFLNASNATLSLGEALGEDSSSELGEVLNEDGAPEPGTAKARATSGAKNRLKNIARAKQEEQSKRNQNQNKKHKPQEEKPGRKEEKQMAALKKIMSKYKDGSKEKRAALKKMAALESTIAVKFKTAKMKAAKEAKRSEKSQKRDAKLEAANEKSEKAAALRKLAAVDGSERFKEHAAEKTRPFVRYHREVNKVWRDAESAQLARWRGWQCTRSTGEGTIYGYECKLLDEDVGFMGIKSAKRFSGPASPSTTGACVQYERVRSESRSVCSCCPKFSCNANCRQTYDLKSRKRFDTLLTQRCERKHPIADSNGVPLANDLLVKGKQQRETCKSKVRFSKMVQDENNVRKDLTLPAGKKMLPVWKKFRDAFGPDWTKTKEARQWYCKTMWKYSAVDLRVLNLLTATSTGYCGSRDTAQIKPKSAQRQTRCEKKIASNYLVSSKPFQVSDVQFVLHDDSTRRARPPGVVWPPQAPPATIWPSKSFAPGVQPDRFEFCTGCCQQLYPKLTGCPKAGKVRTSGGKKYGYLKVFRTSTQEKAGQYEWEVQGQDSPPSQSNPQIQQSRARHVLGENEDSSFFEAVQGTSRQLLAQLQQKLTGHQDRTRSKLRKVEAQLAERKDKLGSAISLLSEEVGVQESDPNDPSIKGDKFLPGFTWQQSAWGRRRRKPPTRWSFPRRRRRYFGSPIEKAAKEAKRRARQAVESTFKIYFKATQTLANAKHELTQRLHVHDLSTSAKAARAAKTATKVAKEKKMTDEEANKLGEEARVKVMKEGKAGRLEILEKEEPRIKAAREQLPRDKQMVDMMRQKQRQIIDDTGEVRLKAEMKARRWSKKAEKAAMDLAKQCQTKDVKSQERWELIGYQKHKIAKLMATIARFQAKIDRVAFAKKQLAVQLKLLEAKAEGQKPIRKDDISDIARSAAQKVDNSIKEAKTAVGKALNGGWKNYVDRAVVKLTTPLYNIKTTIGDMLFEVVKALRKRWWEGQCTTKAVDAYYRLQLQKESGHTDGRGRFYQNPRCEELKSYREPCDSDYVKKCVTIAKPKMDTKAKYRCVRYVEAPIVELHKTVFCPRITNSMPSDKACETQRICRFEKDRHASPHAECTLF